ncbi:TonB-dependent receptor [Rugamonas sp. DEMB1]|uniref:TonB-dependent receptor n=1 Tax=Rugamonas sp. DEMB1 TaxID=3039386 RepID=UPI002449B295|nr:TonB-dependent receptor [Rugamonas sp. DEMB1]WGG51582.1 TonB-dependent receptor [Rugamonas sp. DEMB1]
MPIAVPLRRARPPSALAGLSALLCLLAAPAARAGDEGAPAGAPELVIIYGQGQSRQVQTLGRVELGRAPPGASPLQTLDRLPGVSFQSSDAQGAYEWSTRLSIRGFNQNQLGFTLDGVPLGDMSYGPNNGLHISRAVAAENLGRAVVSQGAGALATASTSNLGGTVQFYSLAPSDAAGVNVGQSVGSGRARRSFVRLDSGLSDGGAKAYLSAARQRADKSKGWGGRSQDQLDAGVAQRWGAQRWSAFIHTSQRHEVDDADLSLALLDRFGYGWDNYAPDFQRAVDAARGRYSGGVASADDAYFLARGLRRDMLAGAKAELELGAAALTATVYHHDNLGQGHWYTPNQASPSGLPLSLRTTEYALQRNGLLADWRYALGRHNIAAGVWGERSRHQVSRNYYDVGGPRDTDRYLSGPFLTAFSQDFHSTTRQWYLSDSVALADGALTVDAGFKAPRMRIVGRNLVAGRAAGTLESASNFLPQAGLNYRLGAGAELFAAFARNLRAFQPGTAGPFSASQAAFDASAAALKPERSDSLELGYRWRRAGLQGSVSLYRSDFRDRLLSVATCTGIAGCPGSFVNVGRVKGRGVEAAASWQLAPDWSWFNSLSYNDTRYQSDYADHDSPVKDAAGQGVVRAAGKQVVDNARRLLHSELSFERGAWFAKLGAKFTDKRYYTYLNDAQVPAYWLASLGAGYRMAGRGPFKELGLQLNVHNLFDRRYLSSIGSNGFKSSDPDGSFATLLSGAPRQLFFSLNGRL